MKVIKRQQVTEVVTNRQVSHTLELDNNIYNRHENIKVYLPYMDCDVITSKAIIKWSVEIGDRTIRYLSKKEVKNLMLEEYFEKLDIEAKNGNS